MTDRLAPGTRARVVCPDEPAFHGLPGTVVRWDSTHARYGVRLDEWPEHQLRFYRPPDPRAADIPLDPDEVEVLEEPAKECA